MCNPVAVLFSGGRNTPSLCREFRRFDIESVVRTLVHSTNGRTIDSPVELGPTRELRNGQVTAMGLGSVRLRRT